MESDLSRDFDRKNDAARATRDFDRAGRSLAPSVSSTIAANAASSRESLRFFSLDRWNAKSKENLRRGLMPRSMAAFGVCASVFSHAFSRVLSPGRVGAPVAMRGPVLRQRCDASVVRPRRRRLIDLQHRGAARLRAFLEARLAALRGVRVLRLLLSTQCARLAPS